MKFHIDAPFWRFMTLLARFTALNVLFVLTCIPVVTIGPALAALYSTVFAYDDNEDVSLHKEYLRRLKREFVPGLLSFLIFLALAAAVIFGLAFWNQIQHDAAYVSLAVLIIAAAAVLLTFEYYYPLQARYANRFGRTWKIALLIPWGTFGHTLLLVVIDVVFLTLILYVPFLRVFALIFGFAWLAYAKSLILLRAFEKFSDPSKMDEQPTYVNSSATL